MDCSVKFTIEITVEVPDGFNAREYVEKNILEIAESASCIAAEQIGVASYYGNYSIDDTEY